MVLGGSMMPFRWSINEQFYPKSDVIVLKKDEPVRFVFKNPTKMDHPFHLHGHSFDVLGTAGKIERHRSALERYREMWCCAE